MTWLASSPKKPFKSLLLKSLRAYKSFSSSYVLGITERNDEWDIIDLMQASEADEVVAGPCTKLELRNARSTSSATTTSVQLTPK